MGQEIVYCFKCQKRILGTELAKGLGYHVGNQVCCSTCVVLVLDTLPPKEREELLAKMYQAQERQAGTSTALKAMPESSTRKIPTLPHDRPVRVADDSSSSAPLMIGIGLGIVAVIVAVVALSGGSSPAPAPMPARTVKIPPPPPPPPRDPGPAPEDRRRTEAAREAMRKARDFAQANPKDADGQLKQWRSAVTEAERTGYEVEARRELDKAEVRAKEALGQEMSELERQVRAPLGRKDFKAAQAVVDQARSRRSVADWSSLIDRLQQEIQDTAARAFAELKEKALGARDRGAKRDVDAVKAEVARWEMPAYVAELDAALSTGWHALFDGKTAASFVGTHSIPNWTVVDGAMVHSPGGERDAGQSRQDYGDGEFRFRISTQGIGSCFIAVRQGASAVRVSFKNPSGQPLADGEHEIVFTCRGLDISATLDGKPVPLEAPPKVLPTGRIQFNHQDGAFRILSIDFRP